jgi:hypothetical protein
MWFGHRHLAKRWRKSRQKKRSTYLSYAAKLVAPMPPELYNQNVYVDVLDSTMPLNPPRVLILKAHVLEMIISKLHRHAALNDVLVGFMEYLEATYEGTNYPDTRHVGIPRASDKPDGPCSYGHKQNSVDF